jgi:AcrR family transcriptional regulator
VTEHVLDAVTSGGVDPEDARWHQAVADELNAEKGRHRISAQDLADRAGVNVVTMRRYFSGERMAPPRVMAVICKAFGVKVSDIWTRAEDRINS